MHQTLKSDLSRVVELGFFDMMKLMFGREIKSGKHDPIHIRFQFAYEAFNLRAPAIPAQAKKPGTPTIRYKC